MSTHEKEKCPECEKQREALLTELFPENLPNECDEWTLPQLKQFKKNIEGRKKTQESIAKSSIGPIANSLLGLKMTETPGQTNKINPGAPIGNQLFNKKMNEV
jgi:hypothetical protein